MDVVGFSLPSTSLQLEPRTIWVSLLVGTVVTVVSALVPARRATKVLPVEALRESTPGAEKPSLRRGLVGLAFVAAGVAGMLSALYGGASMKLFGLGLLAGDGRRDGVAAAGGPSARGADRHADAAARHARRAGEAERDAQPASYVLDGCCPDDRPHPGREHGRLRLLPEGVVRRRDLGPDQRRPLPRDAPAPRLPGSARRSSRRSRASTAWTRSRRTAGARPGSPRRTRRFSAVDPATAEDVMNLEVSAGFGRATWARTAWWSRGRAATAHGWKIGDPVTAEFAATGKHRLHVVGIYDGKGWIGDNFVLSIAEQNAFAGPAARVDRSGHPGRRCRQGRGAGARSRTRWPTTRTLRCWTRRASRSGPAGRSTSCSPSSP